MNGDGGLYFVIPRIGQHKSHHSLRPVAFISHYGDRLFHLVLNRVPVKEDGVGGLSDAASVLQIVHKDLAQVGMVLPVVSLKHFIAR